MVARAPSSSSNLERAISTLLDKRRASSTLRQLSTNPPDSVDFSSNDFLSLATSQQLRANFLRELQDDPAVANLGSGGSRLLDGNSTYAERLEKDIANFHRAPAGLLCNSGFDANAGLFSCLPQPGDLIIYDEFIHASVHDGMKLSRAGKCIPFDHNDVSALRSVLEHCVFTDAAVREGSRNVFVAVETVYSMDGDIAPLAPIVQAVKELLPAGNGYLVVDEAHSTGYFGSQGRGLVCELGLEDQVAIRLHTFGKSLAANGAILLCSPATREYLVNYARPLIYTTFMSYPALAAIRASYSYMMEGKTEPLANQLWLLIATLHERLMTLQSSLAAELDDTRCQELLRVPVECTQSPIFAVLTSEPKPLAAYCQAHGFVVRGIVPPTVPAGSERIRICLHAGNTVEQIEALVRIIGIWVRRRAAALKAPMDVRPRL